MYSKYVITFIAIFALLFGCGPKKVQKPLFGGKTCPFYITGGHISTTGQYVVFNNETLLVVAPNGTWDWEIMRCGPNMDCTEGSVSNQLSWGTFKSHEELGDEYFFIVPRGTINRRLKPEEIGSRLKDMTDHAYNEAGLIYPECFIPIENDMWGIRYKYVER